MSPEQFVEACESFAPVSHETFINLKIYADLLIRWQAKINLISKSTVDDLWQRHFYDSAQLLRYIEQDNRVVDFGSGAGFPAMVLAIMGVQQVSIIESDQRKIAFLQEVARQTETSINLINKRIEQVEPFEVDVISARAFASLANILDHAHVWWRSGTKAVLLKGRNFKDELTVARQKWHIGFRCESSLADPDGSVLVIERAEALKA